MARPLEIYGAAHGEAGPAPGGNADRRAAAPLAEIHDRALHRRVRGARGRALVSAGAGSEPGADWVRLTVGADCRVASPSALVVRGQCRTEGSGVLGHGLTADELPRLTDGCTACTLRDGAWCFGSLARDAEARGGPGVGPRGQGFNGRGGPGVGPRGQGFNGHDTHRHHFVVPMPGAMRPSRPRCARERAVPEPAQWLAPRADPRACSALRVRPRTATRAPCPCTPRERPALCLTGDRHARMGLRGAPTRRGEAPHTHRRSRIQPRGRAPCTAH